MTHRRTGSWRRTSATPARAAEVVGDIQKPKCRVYDAGAFGDGLTIRPVLWKKTTRHRKDYQKHWFNFAHAGAGITYSIGAEMININGRNCLYLPSA